MNTTQSTQSRSRFCFFSLLLWGLVMTGPLEAKVFNADFNGDGKDDIVVGSPRDTVGQHSHAGAVAVRYGDLNSEHTHDQWIMYHRGSPGVGAQPRQGENFGTAISIGDFNGDGYDDLAVSTPHSDIAQSKYIYESAGMVNVFHGSPTGLIGQQNSALHLGHLGPTYLQDEANFGSAMTTGDFNHDGFDDLAVGMRLYDHGTIPNAGGVVLFWGSASGLNITTPRILVQGDALVGEHAEAHDYFGGALTAADFDQDGFDDLAIGAWREGLIIGGQTFHTAGLATILYGNKIGFDSMRRQTIVDSHAPTNSTIDSDEHFGEVLEPGDFNGDGFPDLAIAHPFEDSRASDDGAVTIIWSSNQGLQLNQRQVWNGNSPGLSDPGEDDDLMGRALTAGDFDNDGYDDLAMGVPNEDRETWWGQTLNSTGQVTVLSGGPNGLVARPGHLWHQDRTDVVGTREAWEGFGSALGVADVNHDQIVDLLISVPNENLTVSTGLPAPFPATVSLTTAGQIHVLYGTHGTGLSTHTALGKQLHHQRYSPFLWQPLKAGPFEKFGSVLP